VSRDPHFRGVPPLGSGIIGCADNKHFAPLALEAKACTQGLKPPLGNFVNAGLKAIRLRVRAGLRHQDAPVHKRYLWHRRIATTVAVIISTLGLYPTEVVSRTFGVSIPESCQAGPRVCDNFSRIKPEGVE